MKKEYKKPITELEELKELDIISTSDTDLNKDDEYPLGPKS